MGTLGVLIAVFFMLLFVFYRYVNKPLRKLATATENVSKGKFVKVEQNIDSELGRLTVSFNSMIDSLENEKAEVRYLINQLEISESLFRTLFESAPVGICVVRKDGRLLEANTSLQHIVGYGKEEIHSLSFNDIFNTPGDGTTILAKLEKERSIENFETLLIRKDGTQCQVRMILTLITLDEMEVLLAMVENITEQKRLEDQLQQVRKLEAIGSLAGGVAHDFNNLLAPILGYAEMLAEDLDPEDERRLSIEEILKAGKKARDIVRQLLAFSRKQTLDFKPVGMNKVLSDFHQLLRRTIREDISIETNLDPSIPLIKADVGQLEQVIMNLCVNAQDAMPNGGRIMIETGQTELDESYIARHQEVVPGSYVMLSISDTGHGMNKETLERIFDPFFTTKAKGRGSGFGLATVYGIVKQHGGNIWAYSEPGQGTTFRMYFPASKEDLQPLETMSDLPGDLQGTETILVIEDDTSLLKMIIAMLARKGYTVLSASNVDDLMQWITSYDKPVHLLLTDVIMPEMNGREVFERVSKRWPEIKAIYISGYTDDVIAHHGILEQGIHFIQKPFSSRDLTHKVRQVLGAAP